MANHVRVGRSDEEIPMILRKPSKVKKLVLLHGNSLLGLYLHSSSLRESGLWYFNFGKRKKLSLYEGYESLPLTTTLRILVIQHRFLPSIYIRAYFKEEEANTEE